MRKPIEPIAVPEEPRIDTPMHGGMGQGSLSGRDAVAAQHEETAKIEHAELEAAQAKENEAARLEKEVAQPAEDVNEKEEE